MEQSYPPWLWGPPATGATAGTPGAYTPANAKRPADVAGLAGVAATPATAWTPGQYVPTRAGDAHWGGAAWAAGRAGAAAARVGSSGTEADSPRLRAGSAGYVGTVKPADRPRNLEELAARVDLEDTAPWPAGMSILIGQRGKRAHWTGDAWKLGESPGYASAEPPAGVELTGQPQELPAAPPWQQPAAPVQEPDVQSPPADGPAETPDVQFPGDDTAADLHR